MVEHRAAQRAAEPLLGWRQWCARLSSEDSPPTLAVSPGMLLPSCGLGSGGCRGVSAAVYHAMRRRQLHQTRLAHEQARDGASGPHLSSPILSSHNTHTHTHSCRPRHLPTP